MALVTVPSQLLIRSEGWKQTDPRIIQQSEFTGRSRELLLGPSARWTCEAEIVTRTQADLLPVRAFLAAMAIPGNFCILNPWVQPQQFAAGLVGTPEIGAVNGAGQLGRRLFADGGLTALGLSTFNMSIISVWVGYGVFLLVKKILPKTKSSIVVASGVGALVSVPAAALGFTVQYAIGATGTFSVTTVLGAMVGTHVLIGIGEALITGLTVSAVIASRSDLVYGWKGNTAQLEIRHG
jgi:hypothetical protein